MGCPHAHRPVTTSPISRRFEEFRVTPLDAIRWATLHGRRSHGPAGDLATSRPPRPGRPRRRRRDPMPPRVFWPDANNVKAVLNPTAGSSGHRSTDLAKQLIKRTRPCRRSQAKSEGREGKMGGEIYTNPTIALQVLVSLCHRPIVTRASARLGAGRWSASGFAPEKARAAVSALPLQLIAFVNSGLLIRWQETPRYSHRPCFAFMPPKKMKRGNH